MRIAVIYLAWKPLISLAGMFAEAWAKHPPGIDCDLVVCFNGWNGQMSMGDVREALGYFRRSGVKIYEMQVPPANMLDLPTYSWTLGTLAGRTILGADRACLLNSYSRPRVDGWLEKLATAQERTGGVVGCTGSWESWPAVEAPPWPNPHLRTTGVFLKPEDWLGYKPFAQCQTKEDCWRAESGSKSWTRWLQEKNREVHIVDKAGDTWPPSMWDLCPIFRSGLQEGLLMADNATDAYQNANALMQKHLYDLTWKGDRTPPQGLAGTKKPWPKVVE